MDRAGTVRPASPIYTFILHDYTLINSYRTTMDFNFKKLATSEIAVMKDPEDPSTFTFHKMQGK